MAHHLKRCRSNHAKYSPKQRRKPEDRPFYADCTDPLQLLLVELLSTTRTDMAKLRDKAKELILARAAAKVAIDTLKETARKFRRLMKTCKDDAHWVFNPEHDPEGLPFENVCQAIERDPNCIRDKIFDGMPEYLVKAVLAGERNHCPICGEK